MPRRKQLTPKRLKGTPRKGTTGDESDEIQDADGDPEERTYDEKEEQDRERLEMSESPTASWSVKFTPFGSTTEKVMGTTVANNSSSTSKVFSKGTWYPDDSIGAVDQVNPMGESSQSEDELEKSQRKAITGEKTESKDKVKDSGKVEKKHDKKNVHQMHSASVNTQRDVDSLERPLKHSTSSLVRENLRHFFLDKLKSSGKLTNGDESKKRKLSSEDEHSESVQRASTSNHPSRDSYKHTVLWMPSKTDKTIGSPPHKTSSPEKLPGENNEQVSSRNLSRMSNMEERLGPSHDCHSNLSPEERSESRRERETTRSSHSHSSLPEMANKSKLRDNEGNQDASYNRSLSPSDYYHSHAAGMAYYPTPFMGYGLYPSYPNFVYPYNYGYVMAVPGGLFIPMGHSSYAPSSGSGLSATHAPHKDVPLDLSSCSTTKKEEEEVVTPNVIKTEEPSVSSSGTSSSSAAASGKQSEDKADSSVPKKKGEKTIVLWKKVPRHAMMMDMAQLSVLEKVHVLYTTESTFLCFICSDCHALFNSLDLLALHAVGTAHSSRNDIDVKAMGLKGFEVIPMDKIAKKQKHVDKKTDFSFESPLQSTVSLHRRRLPGSKDYVMKNRDVYKCSVCPDTFPNFLRYTMHMNETGHRRKSVRYSDVYKAQKQVKKILKCMNCEKSFMTLEELTMHMIKTKHYSDIAGGFANQTELDEDADFDHPDHLGHPDDEHRFHSMEHSSPLDRGVPSAKSSQLDGTMEGTSSDNESHHSLRMSPAEQWGNNSGIEDEKEKIDHREDRLKESSKESNNLTEETFSKRHCTEPDHPSQNGNFAGPSKLPSSHSTKRNFSYLDDERKDDDDYDTLCKRIKVEAESAAEEEDDDDDDDDNMTYGGYESENEYEEEDEIDPLDPEYSLRLFHPAHARDREVGKDFCFPTSEMGRRKYRTRIYKHSLLYQSRQHGSETKQDVSAFDGLYNWAKSLGLLSSPSVSVSSKTIQAPKAVVKCDGKYVDPDNFDVTLPYGGKVHPDVNPLRKLSSMVETTQIKQPQNKSFESNFIMDRAYFNFEKTQGSSAQNALAINSSNYSDDQDRHTDLTEEWENIHQQEELSDAKSEIDNKDKHRESIDSSISFPSAEKRSWLLDGTISKDAVLERLILKAYNRPSKSSYRLRSEKEQICSCSAEPEIEIKTGDSETRPSKTRMNICKDQKVDSVGRERELKDTRHLNKTKASCEKCSHLPNVASVSKSNRQQDDKRNTTRVETQRGWGKDSRVNKSEKLEPASVSKDKISVQRHKEQSKQSTASFLSRVGVGKEHLQGLIYGHRDAVREVKFTWADAIDTLISRSFGSEDEPSDQAPADSLEKLDRDDKVKHLGVFNETYKSLDVEKNDVCKETRVKADLHQKDDKEDQKLVKRSIKSDVKTSQLNRTCLEEANAVEASMSTLDDKEKCEVKDNAHKVLVEGLTVTPAKDGCKNQSTAVDSSKDDGLYRSALEIYKADQKDMILKDRFGYKKQHGDNRKSNEDIREVSSKTLINGISVSTSNCSKESCIIRETSVVDERELHDTEENKSIRTDRKGEVAERCASRTLSTDGAAAKPGTSMTKTGNSDADDNLHLKLNEEWSSSSFKNEKQTTRGEKRELTYESPCEERKKGGRPPMSSHRNRDDITNREELIGGSELTPKIEHSSDGEACSSNSPTKSFSHVDSSELKIRKSPSSKEGHSCPASKLPDKMATVATHRPIGYFSCGSPPPLIPSADASTKAIRRLEELTRKPAVTNVKEMILSKIQEEVERLIGPGCEERKVSPPLSSELPYLFPRVDNNNDVDSSRKSLKSLEELSKCAPLPLFKRIQKDVRSRNDEPLINRSDPCVKYLLPSSTTPESTVSAIQSLEKLSAEHPVLRRIEPPQAVTTSPLRPTSADKVQYLPPSFGGEASNANSIQSLERFSSEHSFFGYCLTKPHSKPTNTCCNISMSEKPAQHAHGSTRSLQNGMASQRIASPFVVTLPKLEPLSPVESRTEEDGDHMIRPKMKTEDQESENVDHSQTQGSRRHHESDKESSSQQLISNSSEDPLLALNNLVRKKQGIVASPSPSKVAWELVNKDMKPPLYILPPDDIKNQADKNPLEEIDKMLKFS